MNTYVLLLSALHFVYTYPFSPSPVKSNEFSTGFFFLYWDWWDGKEEFEAQSCSNQHDYGGFKPNELFIKKPKYENLKQEILSNTLNEVGVAKYEVAVCKATNMSVTKVAKKIKACDDRIHCGIKTGSPMTVQHLLALILYTDHSMLCSLFSASLRHKSLDESISATKKRNASYWHLSKTLRESVQLFGQRGKKERGPFFCGMDRVLAVPQFAIRLCAPTSTSKCLAIAIAFANNRGCVLGLNNEFFAGGSSLKCFNVSWLSRYAEEQERLFVGGHRPIQIEDVFVSEAGQWRNFRNHFKALFWFDAVCSGQRLREMKRALEGKEEKKAVSVLSALLAEDDSEQPKYVRDCFYLYRISKTSLFINMWSIERKCPSAFRSLLFDEFVGGESDKDKSAFSDLQGSSNLLKDSVLRRFPNLQHVVLDTRHSGGKMTYTYQFSLKQWFQRFSALSLKKCTLNGAWKKVDCEKEDGRRSWLFCPLASDTVKVELNVTKTRWGSFQDSLVFERV